MKLLKENIHVREVSTNISRAATFGSPPWVVGSALELREEAGLRWRNLDKVVVVVDDLVRSTRSQYMFIVAL